MSDFEVRAERPQRPRDPSSTITQKNVEITQLRRLKHEHVPLKDQASAACGNIRKAITQKIQMSWGSAVTLTLDSTDQLTSGDGHGW